MAKRTTAIFWKPATIPTDLNTARSGFTRLKKWKLLDADAWKVLGAV